MRIETGLAIVSLALAVAATSCSGRERATAIRAVHVALNLDGVSWHPVRLAQQRFASAEGLAITISDVAGGSKGMEALIGGSVDVTGGTLPDAIEVAAEGRDARCFVVLNTRPTMALVAAPAMKNQIHTVADLKGRTVGISSPGSTTHQMLNYVLTTNGLTPSDVSAVSVGIAATAIAALEHGRVDAAVLVASTAITFQRRYPDAPMIVDVRTEAGAKKIFGDVDVPWATLIARDEWLRANPETARRFARAVGQAIEWMRSHSPAEVRDTIPTTMRMPDAAADHEAILQFQQTLTRDGIAHVEGVEAVRKFVAVSDERVRNARFATADVCTNDFASRR